MGSAERALWSLWDPSKLQKQLLKQPCCKAAPSRPLQRDSSVNDGIWMPGQAPCVPGQASHVPGQALQGKHKAASSLKADKGQKLSESLCAVPCFWERLRAIRHSSCARLQVTSKCQLSLTKTQPQHTELKQMVLALCRAAAAVLFSILKCFS